jgi:Trypsin-co-occurring domain 2
VAEEEPSLGQLIWLVRRELEWAYEVDRDHPLRFDVGAVELDLTVEATRSTSGGGGLDLKVLGAGGSGNLSREHARGTTSNMHITLTPVDPRVEGGRYQISARDTEPPSRRVAVTSWPARPVETNSPRSSNRGATDTEQPTGPPTALGMEDS